MVTGLYILTAMFSGWTLRLLWGWFIVPNFNIPPLSIAAAVSITLAIGFLTVHEIPGQEGGLWKRFIFEITQITAALLLGLIIHYYHLFM